MLPLIGAALFLFFQTFSEEIRTRTLCNPEQIASVWDGVYRSNGKGASGEPIQDYLVITTSNHLTRFFYNGQFIVVSNCMATANSLVVCVSSTNQWKFTLTNIAGISEINYSYEFESAEHGSMPINNKDYEACLPVEAGGIQPLNGADICSELPLKKTGAAQVAPQAFAQAKQTAVIFLTGFWQPFQTGLKQPEQIAIKTLAPLFKFPIKIPKDSGAKTHVTYRFLTPSLLKRLKAGGYGWYQFWADAAGPFVYGIPEDRGGICSAHLQIREVSGKYYVTETYKLP